MALFDFINAAQIPRERVATALVLADAPTLNGADAFLEALEERLGPVTLGVVGETAYAGERPFVALPKNHGADRKRLKRLKPNRLVVIGEADRRFDLVRGVKAPKAWINAESAAVGDTGCDLVTLGESTLAGTIPGAQVTGDPLLALTERPVPRATPEPCERFKEYRERGHWVIYLAATGEGEEAQGYGLLFELLRRKTAIMILAPRDAERYEPVYRDAIKYSLPTIRHNRLMTSFIPNKNRVYYIEDAETLLDMYGCADIVIPGGSLQAGAAHAPDILTPLCEGKPVVVGPRREDAWTRAALRAGVVLGAEDVEGLSACARELLENPEKYVEMRQKALEWLELQVGATERVLAALE